MKPFAALALLFLVHASATPMQGTDPAQIDRTILREPKYNKTPRYALLIFGLDSQRRVWLVQDGDVLYVDKNGNRDLTDAGERIEGKREKVGRSNVYRDCTSFLVDGITGAKGETLGLTYQYYPDPDLDSFLHLYADFKPQNFPHYGTCLQGLPGDAQGDFVFSEKRETCPVYHFQGPLSLTRAGTGPFERGVEDENLTVRIGTPGFGQGSFAAIENERVPKDVHPKAEIVFPGKTKDAPPIRAVLVLSQRC